MNKKFKKGDKVKIINREDYYFNCNATIIDNDNSNIPYYCEVKYGNNLTKQWYKESSLQLLKNSEKHFTISIRKHKRLNLNFKL